VEWRTLKENELVMVSDDIGDVHEGRRRLGLYYRDTRYLSVYELTINGQRPRHLASSCQQNSLCDTQLANPTIEFADGTVALARTINIQRTRVLKGGLREAISLFNYNTFPVSLQLTLTFGSDYCDIFEVRGLSRQKRGEIKKPVYAGSSLELSYYGLDDVLRVTSIVFDKEPSSVELEENTSVLARRRSTFLPEATEVVDVTVLHPPISRVTWNVLLEPRKPVSLNFQISVREGEGEIKGSAAVKEPLQVDERFKDWRDQCIEIETDNKLFGQLLERSILDLRMLMNETPEGLIPAAGIPWYSCIFGSHSLIASLQTLMLYPQTAVDTLRYMAKHQGGEVNELRDEEPGKIIQQMRKGEMARTGEIPYGPYYSSIDATPLFLILFAETMKWLDDDNLFHELLPAARSALEWMMNYGDSDDDMYLEYNSSTNGGISGHGWSDNRASITYPDGTPVELPVALAEVQGYAYKAMKEMAVLLEQKGEVELAGGLLQQASTLKEKFNRDFWLDKQRYFAQAIDSKKKAVANIASGVGLCLFSDIIDREKARYVVTRLSSPEMACGWGIRNLSSRSPKFNPMSYRNGSIWPHENSLIIAGMKQYGYHWEVQEITTQLFEASRYFYDSRLPELYGGVSRNIEANSSPAVYPVSCSPQAWAAGSAILLLQSMLGLQVDAAAKRIYLSPRLPGWLQHLSIRKLRVGERTVDLHFDRRIHEDDTRFEISENEAEVEVVIPPK